MTTKRLTCAALVIAAAMSGCIPTSVSTSTHVSPGEAAAPPGDPDARYTVLLQVFTQPDHARIARLYRDRLESELGWRGLFIVTQAGLSELYWGAFETGAEANETLLRARDHKTQIGSKPFLSAIVTAMPGTREKMAQWDLANCTGDYSLLVAVFEDLPYADPPYLTRRTDAEDYCAELRRKGLEAWFYHGPGSSSVTLGSFPASAIEIKRVLVNNAAGRPIRKDKPVPVDPALINLMERFPTLAVNGRKSFQVTRDAAGNVISRSSSPDATYPVKVPNR